MKVVVKAEEYLKKIWGEIDVAIRGITPLLMNRVTPEELMEDKVRRGKTREEIPKEVKAERAAYRTEEGYLYIPGIAIYACILNGAKGYSVAYQGRRISAKTALSGTIRIQPEKVILKDFKGNPITKYEIDESTGNIQKNRVAIFRPRINEWKAEFKILYNRALLNEKTLELLAEIIMTAGSTYGLLDYRPEHKGWFGCFILESYEVKTPPLKPSEPLPGVYTEGLGLKLKAKKLDELLAEEEQEGKE